MLVDERMNSNFRIVNVDCTRWNHRNLVIDGAGTVYYVVDVRQVARASVGS